MVQNNLDGTKQSTFYSIQGQEMMGGKTKTNEDEVEHNNQPNKQTKMDFPWGKTTNW